MMNVDQIPPGALKPMDTCYWAGFETYLSDRKLQMNRLTVEQVQSILLSIAWHEIKFSGFSKKEADQASAISEKYKTLVGLWLQNEDLVVLCNAHKIKEELEKTVATDSSKLLAKVKRITAQLILCYSLWMHPKSHANKSGEQLSDKLRRFNETLRTKNSDGIKDSNKDNYKFHNSFVLFCWFGPKSISSLIGDKSNDNENGSTTNSTNDSKKLNMNNRFEKVVGRKTLRENSKGSKYVSGGSNTDDGRMNHLANVITSSNELESKKQSMDSCNHIISSKKALVEDCQKDMALLVEHYKLELLTKDEFLLQNKELSLKKTKLINVCTHPIHRKLKAYYVKCNKF